MLRTLLSPRLVGLHLVTIGVLISFTILGRWQLGVFEDSGRPHAVRDPAPVALSTLVHTGERVPVEAISRQVTVEGTFEGERQLLVAERQPTVESGGGSARDGGYWLLTPLRLPDGTLVPVVRGWVSSPGDPAVTVPQGTVSVTGRVQPPEPTDFAQRRIAPLPEGQVSTVSTAELINIWRGVRLQDGFVVATEPVPATSAATQLVSVPPPTLEGGFTWRNLAYAAQWWIFAAFAVFMWFHFVRDAVRGRPAGATGDDPRGGAAAPALGTSPQG